MPRPKSNDPVAVLYARVSTDLQAENGYSLQEQEVRLRDFARSRGWTVHAVYLDPGFSGASLDRPGIQKVIADCQAGRVQKVVTYKLDRLSRSQKDTLYLIEEVFIKNQVDYVSVTESLDTGTPLGMAMIGILSVFAQLEREQIAERMMMGRVAAAKEGRWRGGSGVPIGYRYTPRSGNDPGRLDIEPYEAEQVREVFRLFLAGWTYHAIWAHMQAAGYTTAYGKFGAGGAARVPAMLTNRAYIGEIKYQGIWYPGQHEPIIDVATFARAQDLIAEYTATLDQHRRKPFEAKKLLTGFLWCGCCGARVAWHYSHYTSRKGEYIRYEDYRCYTRLGNKKQRAESGCTLDRWPVAELEDAVWSQVEALRWDASDAASETTETQDAYRARIAEIDKQRGRLVDLYAVGGLSLDAITSRAEALANEKASLLEAIAALDRGSARLTRDEFNDAIASVSAIRSGGDVKEQRRLLTMLIKKITLMPDGTVVIDWNL